ncbi:inorganic pyrophosphatase [Tribonema minus]|uniref:inorganic diphosphatase n=1 Tax=Tribonema minus TaxID=303371 RepID=A0A835YXT5_9STRA|nr:inorganic pyrophosphatase [Tribonema minus]
MRRNSNSSINLVSAGEEGTLEYRIQHVMEDHDSKVISAWHDIPLYVLDEFSNKPTGLLNFVCEIPRCSRKKFEIATKEPGNPIKQDEKKGVLREFKKGDIFFNYGCFPRTWEDPEHSHPDTGCAGDNDPLDVCEIGMRIVPTGDVRQVKVLGVLAMIDDGETDWKVIAIDADDRWAPELNDVEDVERLLPGVVDSIREWFRTYKIPDGKPPNVFGLGERCMPRTYAMKVINECYLAWKTLVSNASLGGEVPRNLSVSKLTDLMAELEPDHVLSASDHLEATSDGEAEDYPASLIA